VTGSVNKGKKGLISLEKAPSHIIANNKEKVKQIPLIEKWLSKSAFIFLIQC
jgi:methionine aminopeptidase